MRSCKRIKSKITHAADFRQRTFQIITCFQYSLYRRVLLLGMYVSKAGILANFLVYFWIVFHCATPKRIKARINSKVIVAHVCIMTHNSHFVDFGQLKFCLSFEIVRQQGRVILRNFIIGQ